MYGIELDEDALSGAIVVSYISPNIQPDNDLARGDNVISIDGRRIKSLEDFIDRFRKSGRRMNFLEVSRNSRIHRINFGNHRDRYE